MRWIDRDALLTDPEVEPLIEAAEAARLEILAEPDPVRRDAMIKNHRQKWIDFRSHFANLSFGKCWYTECENPGTDDDIDHFRPKGDLAEDRTHGGYWWEALNWCNFRLSCHRSNRLRINPDTDETHGKGDHFPLAREEERCRYPDDDLCRESPLLLDPTDPFDPPLLGFDISGKIAVAPEYVDDAEVVARIEASRIYLHLDWPPIKRQRRDLYNYIRRKVIVGDRWEKRTLGGNRASREPLKEVARELIAMTKPDQPYSEAAKAYIRTFRNRAWIKQAVLPHCN
jgi:hypothetical protein